MEPQNEPGRTAHMATFFFSPQVHCAIQRCCVEDLHGIGLFWQVVGSGHTLKDSCIGPNLMPSPIVTVEHWIRIVTVPTLELASHPCICDVSESREGWLTVDVRLAGLARRTNTRIREIVAE